MKKKLVLMTSALMAISLLAGCGNKHVHNWGDVVYEWSTDHTSCTATRVCKDDESHKETETKDSVYAVTKEAKCEEDGSGRYTVTFDNEVFGTTHFDITLEQIGHEWGEVTYMWTDDYSSCTATRVCKNDSNHIESETASSAYTEIIPATCDTDGSAVYDAAFQNKAFEVQTHEITLPATGHEWGNPTYEWSEDDKYCTATVICGNDSAHKLEETVECTYKELEAATEEADGKGKYTATFENEKFVAQEKEVVIESLPTLSKLAFTSNGDGTYSVQYKDRFSITGRVKIPSTYGDGEAEGSVTSLPNQAFFGADEITEVFIPSSIKTIGSDAFYKCEKMTDIHFADNSVLESIGDYAFERCHSLVSVTLPKSIKTFGQRVFDELNNLESVVFEEGNELESVGSGLFEDCPKLKTIRFAETSKFKELDYTFDNLGALEELDLPNSVESIKTYSIRDCSSLKTLWLSKGLKTLEIYCIDTCPIENLHFKGTVEEWNTISKENNWRYQIATNVVHCTDGDVAI